MRCGRDAPTRQAAGAHALNCKARADQRALHSGLVKLPDVDKPRAATPSPAGAPAQRARPRPPPLRQVGLRWRVKNSRDVVPKIRLSPYYAHVGRELLVGRVDPYPDLAMFSDLPDHFCPQYIKGLDELSDSWFSMLDLTAILPLRIHAALINSSYRIWRYCTQLSGE